MSTMSNIVINKFNTTKKEITMKKLKKPQKNILKVYSCYTNESVGANNAITSVISGTFTVGAVVVASTVG